MTWYGLKALVFALLLSAAPRAEAAANAQPLIPSRQAHLDFHTSELVPDVGSRFSKANWQEALRLGQVNWINIFAKCHHGWSYYPTKVGRQHPTLTRDLMGEQITASHEIGVRCPIYYTVGWSAADAEAHPEWRVRNKDGSFAARSVDFNARPEDPRPPTSWVFLCPSGDYLHLMLRQTEEICEMYPVDGFFYDIDNVSPPCFCQNCRNGMLAEAINIDDDKAVAAYEARKWKRFFAAARQVIQAKHPNATVFFNGTSKLLTNIVQHAMWQNNTQQELEDLPTTWGGYDKFALRSKFFHKTGRPIIGMSGKFHTSWGEFGGFKHPDALRYEAAAMVAFGASCNFGDQLHPSGEMDLETYRNIGFAYDYVRQIESYGVGAKPVSRLGLWRTGSMMDDEGVSNMLMETQHDYVVADEKDDLSRYDAIVVTGASGLSATAAAKLNAFAAAGGGLLVLGDSPLDEQRRAFVLNVGATYAGPAQFEIDYTVVGPELGTGMVASPFLNYRGAARVAPKPGTQVLASLREPYFDRTYAKYSSHLNTPYQLTNSPYAAAVQTGRTIYLPHRLGESYYTNGARLHRQLFENALKRVYTNEMVSAALPSAGRVTLLHQPESKRYVAHLLYAPPLQRGRCLVIEDIPELRDVELRVRLPQTPTSARLIPGETALKLAADKGAYKVAIPAFRGHTAVVFTY